MSFRLQVALLVVSFVALIIAVGSGIQRQADSSRLRDYIACQAAVNEASALSQRARAAAAEQDRASDRAESEATRRLILTVFTATGPDARDQARAAFATYEKALAAVAASRADADRQRQANPLPPLPSETCR